MRGGRYMFAPCRHVRRFSRLRQVPTRPDTFCRSIGAAESPAQPCRTDKERYGSRSPIRTECGMSAARYVKRGSVDRVHSAQLYGSVDRSVQLRGSETSDTARSVAMPISRVRHIPIRRNHFILFLYFR